MKTFYTAVIAVLASSPVMANESSVEDKDFKSLSNTILIKDEKGTLTLQDIVLSMGLKPSDFSTQHSLPTDKERKALKSSAHPIVVWENPQEIENPNPPC